MSERLHQLIVRKPALARAGRGHPWIFANEVEHIDDAAIDGAEVLVKAPDGDVLGAALLNRHALIVARIFSPKPCRFDSEMLRTRLRESIARRGRLTPAPSQRLVFSEADGLPGLTVDRYGPLLVVQLTTLAMEQRREEIISLLADETGAATIVERSDSPARENEGLPPRSVVARGMLPSETFAEVGGLRMVLDPLGGQKTGLYLDQAANWGLMATLSPGRRVLDLFCNAGGFALSAARAGAASVLAVDSSEPALEALRRNADLNSVPGVRSKRADAIEYARARPSDYDLIICDPPPFARSAKQLKNALRGYRELNRSCLRMLPPGGFLLTFSCSGAVTPEVFHETLVLAARDAGRTLRQLPFFAQPPDHPILLAMPESHYLKGLLLEVV